MAYKWDGLHNLGHLYRRPVFLFYVSCRDMFSSYASPGSDFPFLLVSEIKGVFHVERFREADRSHSRPRLVGHSTGQRH